MYRSARPLLGLGRAAVAMRPQTFTRALPTAKRIAAAPGPVSARGYAMKANPADLRLSNRLNKQAAVKDSGYSASEIEKSMAMAHIMLPGMSSSARQLRERELARRFPGGSQPPRQSRRSKRRQRR